jgi:hypothetical protein
VRLACLRGRCEGRFSIAASAGAGPRYGAKRFSIRRGAVARLRVALTRRASVALRDTRRLSVLATITVLRPGAPALVKRVELTLVEKGGTR